MERRFAAILAADVVGYSRLMGEDEAGTLNALRVHRKKLNEPKIGEHKGRIVKLMGDGLLVEFPVLLRRSIVLSKSSISTATTAFPRIGGLAFVSVSTSATLSSKTTTFMAMG